MKILWPLVAALALSACNPWTTRYEPQGRPEAKASVRKATRFLANESPALSKVGGRPLGALEIAGTSMVVDRPEDLHQRARSEGAQHGATHFIQLDTALTAADLAAINGAFDLKLTTGDLVAGSRKTLYLLVVVPREGWSTLPPDLQPLP